MAAEAIQAVAARPPPIIPGIVTAGHYLSSSRAPKLGIGVVTYDRAETAFATAADIRRFTRIPFEMVIADDGSPEGSVDSLRAVAPVITGRNHGVTWNKNRALHHLLVVKQCDIIILLEDDTRPVANDWERPWIEAADRWGHANLAGHWFLDTVVSGSGSPADPFLSRNFSGQCTVFSREALNYVGYLDTRYRGFGIGHVDHTTRLARVGYGASLDAAQNMLFFLITSDLQIVATESARKEADVQRNHTLYHTLQHEPVYRSPWSTDDELCEFRREQQSLTAI